MIEIEVDDHDRENDHAVEIDIEFDQIEQVNRRAIETSAPVLKGLYLTLRVKMMNLAYKLWFCPNKLEID